MICIGIVLIHMIVFQVVAHLQVQVVSQVVRVQVNQAVQSPVRQVL